MSHRSIKPTIHLICNAHLDPVWLWEWEEGAAEALSTFRTAADLCDEFPASIFNHNEAVLYEWVEEYEPALFKRIQKLVKAGRWHIMGGWYLQPDCNMPSGEAFARQALIGKRYFLEKFGVEPRTVINFDPFGHDRGLVQIMAKSGSDSYIHCRPAEDEYQHHKLPGDLYRWVGYDGSEVLVCRPWGHYLSYLGQAADKINRFRDEAWDGYQPHGIVLWGVGNHGGGPSRKDLRDLEKLIAKHPEITHSTPETFFDHVRTAGTELPVHEHDVRPWGVGCYVSMAMIKRKYRELESELFRVEKMCSTAWLSGLMDYPRDDLAGATRDLLFAQFHDILPGSCIEPSEAATIRTMDHGLELLSRLKARSFFALAAGQPKAKDGVIPVMVYNPHPYPVTTTIACEFQLADQNHAGTFFDFDVRQGRKTLPAQIEQELSNLNFLDWRKRVVFNATLEPSSMNRFDCHPKELPAKPKIKFKARNGKFRFDNGEMEVIINAKTGLIDRYRVGDRDAVGPNAMRPMIMHDTDDPWSIVAHRFPQVVERFKPMSRTAAGKFAGLGDRKLDSVRVIEDGPARSVIEALLQAGESKIVLRYHLPNQGTQFHLNVRAHWNEKNRMLKLEVPTPSSKPAKRKIPPRFIGQAAYGTSDLPDNGDEAVAHQWMAVLDDQRNVALSVINDATYAGDFKPDRLRLTLLRSPAYACHPDGNRIVMPTDRFLPRIDQGERLFNFWFDAGPIANRLARLDREALACNEKPYALSFFPSGAGDKPTGGLRLSDKIVQITAVKKAEQGDALIVRLFNPTDRPRKTRLSCAALDFQSRLELGAYEILTLRLTRKGAVREVDLLER